MINFLFVFIGTLLVSRCNSYGSNGRDSSDTRIPVPPISNNKNEVKHPLDTVLMGYDRRVRPHFGGMPVSVGVSAYVLSISSISEVDMVN